MRHPRTAIIVTGIILPAFALVLIVATQPGRHTTTQQDISLKPATSTSQVKGTSTAQIIASPTSAQAAQTAYAPTAHKQTSNTPQTPTTTTANNDTPTPPTTALSQTPNTNQPGNEQPIELHIGGYPPATGAVLTPDFENPTHVPCNSQYTKSNNCTSSYQWETTKYCIFTYADGHTLKQPYQYQTYPDIYSNSDGSLNPSGVNMTFVTTPAYSCDVAHAPSSVFEQNYIY